MNRRCIQICVLALGVLSHELTARAMLFSADDPRYGAGKLTLDTSSGLAWLDLTVSSGLSYQQVLAEIQPGGAFSGFRHATTDEVFGLWRAAGIPGTGEYSENSAEGEAIKALISLVGATSSQDDRPEAFGVSGTGNGGVHDRLLLDFGYLGGVPGYRLAVGGQGDTYGFPGFGSWLVEPIPEPGSIPLALLIGLLVLARKLTAVKLDEASSCRRVR